MAAWQSGLIDEENPGPGGKTRSVSTCDEPSERAIAEYDARGFILDWLEQLVTL
jgi:hypothetical protein